MADAPAIEADETDGPVAPPVTRWYAVIVLCVALLHSFADRLVINLVVDPIRADLSLTDVEISLLQGAGFAVIFALAALPCGRLADSVNRRNLVAVGLVVWSAATIACGLASDFWSFLAARIAVGLGEAALVPAASSLIIDLFSPRRRGIALGIFSLGATFGTGCALFGGGLVLSGIEAGWFRTVPGFGALVPWRQLMIVIGIPGVLLLPFVLVVVEPVRRHTAGLLAVLDVIRRLVADNGRVLRVCLVKGALSAGDYGLISWLPTLLRRNYGMTALEAGSMVAGAITVSGLVASLLGGAISDWLVRRWGTRSRAATLLGCYALTLCGAVAFLVVDRSELVALAFAVWALGSISGYVVGHVVMQENVPNEMRATTIALSLTITALLGIGLGPTLVPLVARHGFGREAALQSAMGVVSLLAALLAFVVIWPVIRTSVSALGGHAVGRVSISARARRRSPVEKPSSKRP